MIQLFFFFLITFACEILGTIGGFGSSVFFVPAAQFFYELKVVLGLTAVLHVFSNLAKIILFHKTISMPLVIRFGIPGIIGVVTGALLVTRMRYEYVNLLLGAFLVIFSMIFLIRRSLVIRPTKANAVTGGTLAGFLAGFTGTGGAVRGAAMAAYNLEKNLFVGTSAAIDMGVDLSRSFIYLDHNFLNRNHLHLIPVLLMVSFLGSYAGKMLLQYISQDVFRSLVLVLILVIGLGLLVKSLSVQIN